jgi:putative phage-type endonuclease
MQQQLEQDWLEWRRNGIGGSDAPVIMGVSPWKDEADLWNEKVNAVYAQKVSPAMQHGKDKEEEALRECENLLGISLFKMDRVQHPAISWLRGNLDGIDFNEQIIVEIKNPYSNPDDHIAAIGKMVPIKYYPQCMHYFLLKPKVTTVFYFSRYKGNNALVEVNRNQSYLDELYEKEEKFWDKVIKKIPPKEEKEVIDFHDWQEYKEYSKKEKEAKDRLIQISGGKNAIGCGYKLSKQMQDGFLDTDRLKSDYPDIPWESYKKEPFVKWRLAAIRK